VAEQSPGWCRKGRDREQARGAARRIEAMRAELKLSPFDWEEWKGYRDEGRR